MQVNVNKGTVVITLLSKEQERLKQARSLLEQIGKHGDSQEATEAAERISTVLKQFCPAEKAT